VNRASVIIGGWNALHCVWCHDVPFLVTHYWIISVGYIWHPFRPESVYIPKCFHLVVTLCIREMHLLTEQALWKYAALSWPNMTFIFITYMQCHSWQRDRLFWRQPSKEVFFLISTMCQLFSGYKIMEIKKYIFYSYMCSYV